MAEETVVSTASEEVQAKAEKLGWMPPSRFKGDPERFIDAEDYLERGETVLPIVKEQNKRLHAEIMQLRTESGKTVAALTAAQKAIESMEERHSVETQKAVEAARRDLKVQLAAASEAGDHEGVAELTDQLVLMNAAEKKAEKVAASPEAPAAFVPDPDLAAWTADNPWFVKDLRKQSLALGIARELREGGDTSTGRAFYDTVTRELNTMLGGQEESRSSKVEGARSGGEDAGVGSTGKKGFSALPADAKAACDADARKFVGPAKRYKTQAEWRNRYAEIYFEGA